MIKQHINNLIRDPAGFIKRSFRKVFLDRAKYKQGEDYNASRYWNDRFSKYGYNLQGAGNEGLTSEENQAMYKKAEEVFRSIIARYNIDFKNSRILEIGVGAAFYTRILRDLGVENYSGVDIADVLFAEHIKQFPNFKFIKKDITQDEIDGNYDLILMIDVSQHIVKEEKIINALNSVKSMMAENGKFIIAPLSQKSEKHHYYVHTWSPDFIRGHFQGYEIESYDDFRGDTALVISVEKQK